MNAMGPYVRALLRTRAEVLGAADKRGKRAFVSEAEVRALLEGDGDRDAPPTAVDLTAPDARGEPTRLRQACVAWGLDREASLVLGVLAALEANPTLREVALSLSGDPSVASVTPLLVAELVAEGDAAMRTRALRAALPGGPLADLGVVVGAGRAGLVARQAVGLDPRILAFLRGDAPGGLWQTVGQEGLLLTDPADHDALDLDAEAIQAVRHGLKASADRRPEGMRFVLVGSDGRLCLQLIHMFAGAAGEPILVADASEMTDDVSSVERLDRLCRDAALHGAVLYLDGVDGGMEPGGPWAREALRRFDAFDGAVVLGLRGRRPELVDHLERAVTVVLPNSSTDRQTAAMSRALGGSDAAAEVSALVAPRYTMVQDVIEASATQAMASAGGEVPSAFQLSQAIRRQLKARIGEFAESVALGCTLDDLRLEEETRSSLDELISAYLHRDRILNTWGLGARISNARAVSGLFYGPPGTGKTMTASAVARALGTELFKVDLSKVVDKYIGETEKHLTRIFDEAERGQVVLLFDEADSLFSKRTSVKRATDRYANLEVNFLLQRLERHDGVVLLTTNHDALIDEAFKRRIRYRVHFPMPGAEERAHIWRHVLPADAPLDDGVDYEWLGEAYEMSGGHIRNAALRAGFSAAHGGGVITEDLLVDAANAEYQSMGKVVRQEE